jgi:ribosomal protein S18 acetylase RimI-like enzyme
MLGQLGALLAVERAGRRAADRLELGETTVRPARPDDRRAIAGFLEAVSSELARALPPATQLVIAEASGRLVGLASWAPWRRDRGADDPRGFDGLDFPDEEPAEFTLLAVAPEARGYGIGRRLTDAVAEAASAAGSRRLLAWTLADSDAHPSSIAARAFFRSSGFTDLAVDRRIQARGEDRLVMCLSL